VAIVVSTFLLWRQVALSIVGHIVVWCICVLVIRTFVKMMIFIHVSVLKQMKSFNSNSTVAAGHFDQTAKCKHLA